MSGYSNEKENARRRQEAIDASGGEILRSDGPTIEEFVRRGYLPPNYPPAGYLPVDTVGWQEESARREADPGRAVAVAATAPTDQRANDASTLTEAVAAALKQTESLGHVREQRGRSRKAQESGDGPQG